MPKPTGQQWVKLYRGLYDVPGDSAGDNPNIGRHWTTSPYVAKLFAQYGTTRPSRYAADDSFGGSVVEAIVHRRHIVRPDDPEAAKAGVYPEWHPDAQREQEVTLRRGAPVHLRKATEVLGPLDETDEDDPWEQDFPMSRKSIRRA
jgi:hypothetical protein